MQIPSILTHNCTSTEKNRPQDKKEPRRTNEAWTWPGIARILSDPAHGNMAVALLARRAEPLNDLVKSLQAQQPDAVLAAFPTDTAPDNLRKAFADIKAHEAFAGLKLRLTIFSIKNSSKKPFLSETYEEFMAPLEAYVGGTCVFPSDISLPHHPRSCPAARLQILKRLCARDLLGAVLPFNIEMKGEREQGADE